ncbi:hypothetical protein [Spirosoma aerophilum]
MKKSMKLGLVGLGCCLSTMSLAQEKFSNCSAAFVSSKLLVDHYTPTGQCRLSANAKGNLSVSTVALTPTQTKALNRIDFKLAICDKETKTVHLFSDKTYRQIPVQRVLSHCKKGDQILLLTTNSRYALPHNTILVQ